MEPDAQAIVMHIQPKANSPSPSLARDNPRPPAWFKLQVHQHCQQLPAPNLQAHLTTCVGDVREGFVEITRHTLALLGLVVVAVTLTFFARPGLQASASEALMGWLEMRQADTLDIPEVSNAASRSTATAVKNLPKDQLAVTYWLSRKYRVSPEPMGALVSEAWAVGERSQIAPTLILAVMAIESKFNPFASGSQGGMGLMQIEPQAQSETLKPFGGRLAAFDPLTNLRVGSRLLQELLQKSDTVEEALQGYAMASGQLNDNQYIDRVLTEQKQLERLTRGLTTASIATRSAALKTPFWQHTLTWTAGPDQGFQPFAWAALVNNTPV
eukprot:gene23677-28691_t